MAKLANLKYVRDSSLAENSLRNEDLAGRPVPSLSEDPAMKLEMP